MQNIKVCVVDDDIAYMYLVKLVIREVSKELDIISFTDGDIAFDFISENVSNADSLPDVILLDINMPRMDGWMFMTEYARLADKLAKPVSIYILSSSISESDLSKARENALITDYISKPLDESRFREVLDALGRMNKG